jgi:hypothetical protein
MSNRVSRRSLLAVCAFITPALLSPSVKAAISWATAYDQTSSTTNQLRAIAVAKQAGNDSIYGGFIQTTGGFRDVHRFSTNSPYTLLNSRDGAAGSNDQPKAIATDDAGNVFVGNRISGGNLAKITAHNASLGAGADTSVDPDQFGGLATVTIAGQYYLYASREASKEIRRYTYNPATPGTIALDGSFGAGGIFTMSTPVSGILRGLEVTPDGTIHVASRDDGKIYRISADLTTELSAAVPRAMDVDVYNGEIYVSSYNGTSSLIRVLNAQTLVPREDLTITTLDANPYSRGALEGFSGIDIDSTGRIWLGDQSYQASGTVKDRLLVSSAAVPEPAAALSVVASVCVLLRRRRR